MGFMRRYGHIFYGYVALLLANLTGCDRSYFIRLPMPGAKLGSTAPHALFVLLEVEPQQPRSLANA